MFADGAVLGTDLQRNTCPIKGAFREQLTGPGPADVFALEGDRRAVDSSAKPDETDDARESQQPHRASIGASFGASILDGTSWREEPSRTCKKWLQRRAHGPPFRAHGERSSFENWFLRLASKFVRLET